jgi:hypothetical protein
VSGASVWERAAPLWAEHLGNLNDVDKSAASSLFLYLLLPLVPAEAELPDAVREGMGQVLHKAGVKEGDDDVVSALDRYFKANPLSAPASAALSAFLEAFLPTTDAATSSTLGAQLDRLGVATSSRPVGSTPPPAGSVRGGLAARLQQTIKKQ